MMLRAMLTPMLLEEPDAKLTPILMTGVTTVDVIAALSLLSMLMSPVPEVTVSPLPLWST